MNRHTIHVWIGTACFSGFRRLIIVSAVLGVGFALPGISHAQLLPEILEIVPAIQARAAEQIAQLQQISAAKTATQNKIGSRLYLGLLHQRLDARLASLTQFQFLKPEIDNRVPVDIIIGKGGDVSAVLKKLQVLDAVLVSSKQLAYSSRTLRARVRLSDLETLAGLAQISAIQEPIPFATNAVNVSEGDATHGAAQARSSFGVNGAGVKVCVISDGVNTLEDRQASGDLPAVVDVLPGQFGTGDEGTAMLEIVHDLAPAAKLGFATANPTQAQFAKNIRDLASDGCDIIVDDILNLAESPFQDGPIAQAVNDVTAAGVLYFSSVGNEGNKTDGTAGTWEGNFLPSAMANPTSLASAGALHNFGDGGISVSITQGSSNTPIILTWAEHYNLTQGLASTNYDLYLMDSGLTTVLNASTNIQDGVGDNDAPLEYIPGVATGNRIVVARKAAGTTAAPMFNLILFRGRFTQARTTPGATRGHSAAVDAFSTAATRAPGPGGPFPGQFTASNVSETFSSDGPRRIILSPTGAELTPGNRSNSGGVVRQKPDITAADGVATATPGFNPFYGTSAAAPHAAAIAALLKSALPSLTPVQVRSFLTSTAIDIETAGVDRNTGAGIVMPGPALAAAGATPQAHLTAGSAALTQITGDGDAYIEPNETWSIRISLTNIGGGPATATSATLSTAIPNLTMTTATSAYPDIATAATANNVTAFVFRVEPTFPCGSAIKFSLNSVYSGTHSPQMFAIAAGASGAIGPQQSFSYSAPPVPIADVGANAVAAVSVSGIVGTVGDVNLSIDGAACTTSSAATTVGIDHTAVGDLEVRLVSPGGSLVTLIDNAGASGHNFCQTQLDDESAGAGIQTVTSSQAPFSASFKPANPLSALDGGAANGTWQVQVQDLGAGDVGSIRAYTLGISAATCDAPPVELPKLRINDPSIAEGDAGTKALTFKISLSGASSGNVSVKYATADGFSAKAGSDYVGTAGTLDFAPGQTSKTVTVLINGDTVPEAKEYFYVDLSNAVGASIADSRGNGYINNDDPVAIKINDPSIAEGDAGTKALVFTITLSGPSPGNVSVNYATSDGFSAKAGSDYVATSGTLDFAPGQTSKTVSVLINGDTVPEAKEYFYVDLSNAVGASIADSRGNGYINNDDPVAIKINDPSIAEGDTGAKALVFTIVLSGASSGNVRVNYATADGFSAKAGSDYVATSGTLDFAPGQTSKTVSVLINGDTVPEAKEYFYVDLSNAVGATISDSRGNGYINNDD